MCFWYNMNTFCCFLHSELLHSHCEHCNANKAELNLKRTYDVGVCVPSFICVDQIVSCWSVQRADRDRLPYGNTGRRERDERWQEVVREEREQRRGRGESVGSEKGRRDGISKSSESMGTTGTIETGERVKTWVMVCFLLKMSRQRVREWVAEPITWKQRRWPWGVFTARWCVMIQPIAPTLTHKSVRKHHIDSYSLMGMFPKWYSKYSNINYLIIK